MLPMEEDVVGRGFNFEKSHPELFAGEALCDSAIYYSRKTRDNYGGYQNDYGNDYVQMTSTLFDAGVKFEVLNTIPHPSSSCRKLFLPSAAVLTYDEIRDLEIFRLAGGRIYATGPCGVYDENCRRRATPYIEELLIDDIKRPEKWPHNTWDNTVEAVQCQNPPGWREVKKNLYWNPLRSSANVELPEGLAVSSLDGFFDRSFMLDDNRIVKHFLAKKFTRELNEDMENKREKNNWASNSLVTNLFPVNTQNEYTVELPEGCKTAQLVLPLDGGTFSDLSISEGKAKITLLENCFYFLIVCQM